VAQWHSPALRTRLGIQLGGGIFDELTVPGINSYEATPRAIARARDKAAERGLATAARMPTPTAQAWLATIRRT
jgi:hypothetical protein